MKINGIISDSIVDGPGLRTTIFFQGCLRHCPGCHNPQTWECDTGIDVTPKELLDAIVEKGGQNITLSGGEPLLQAKEIVEFIRLYKAKYPLNNVWLWTGARIEDVQNHKDYAGCNSNMALRLIYSVDYIVDGAFMLDKRDITLKFRGSSNQRIWHHGLQGFEDVTQEMDPR